MAEILVIDDEDLPRNQIYDALTSSGFDVDVAMNGEEGIAKFDQDESIKLVLSDFHMPGMDGLDVAAHINDSGRRVPVLFLTTEQSPELRTQGRLVNVKSFIIKPVNKNALIAGVNAAIYM